MRTWRRKAIECAPELKKEFEAADLSPYTVFMELLPATVQAHVDKDNERLKKIYDFAEWCFRQKEKELWNAAGVSFYEHLVDQQETFMQFNTWIKRDIYLDIRELLNQRADEKQMRTLDKFYAFKQK